MIFDFADMVTDGVEFLIALGSIFGFLMLIVGILGWMVLGHHTRQKMIGVVVAGIILLTVCGFSTGIKYFHIY
ncbi:hypothetical protein LCGC14_0414980 [marine sediment metagenome]|uniref:Uncharacterized protein n=1 Tax=marine sediment metagenome TaxID=412755 RepID=A0A0F9VEM4_9ZZZZ|nr:hypothetical protein [archaeon]